MKNAKTLLLVTIAAFALVGQASAACYADYKAKRDKPLRLHYGVIELSDAACKSKAVAAAEISILISNDDWQLLNVMSLFGDDGLNTTREESAGEFYLRY
jgi:hypothetical protein